MVHVMSLSMLNVLYFNISTLRSTHAVPNMDVVCSSLILCFPGMLLRYFLNDFVMVPLYFLLLLLLLLLLLRVAACFRFTHGPRLRVRIASGFARVVQTIDRIAREKTGLFSVRNWPSHPVIRTTEGLVHLFLGHLKIFLISKRN